MPQSPIHNAQLSPQVIGTPFRLGPKDQRSATEYSFLQTVQSLPAFFMERGDLVKSQHATDSSKADPHSLLLAILFTIHPR